MTCLSWRPRRNAARTSDRAARTPIARAWHTACFLLLANPGCFYPGPIPDLETNVAPELIASAVASGQPIQVGERGVRVFVIAQDPDGDDVRFVWSLSEEGVIGTAVPIEDGSQVELAWDETLDEQELTCFVYDGKGNVLTLSWPLEVL